MENGYVGGMGYGQRDAMVDHSRAWWIIVWYAVDDEQRRCDDG